MNTLFTILLIAVWFIFAFITAKRMEGTTDERLDKKYMKHLWLFTGLIIVLVLLCWSWVIVPAGETGVYHLFGKVREAPLSSGFHFKNPMARVTLMSIRTEEYTMSIATAEGKIKGDDSIDALTKEGLKVKLDITILHHLVEVSAPNVYRELGVEYEVKIIRPSIRSAIRSTVANYEAKDIYSKKRAEVENTIFEDIKNAVEPRGIAIEKVMLRNVILPGQLANAIEQKLSAEQEAQKMEFVLAKAEKEAERKGIEAIGIRTAQETIQRTLTPAYLRWYSIEMMKSLAGSQNTTFLFVPVDEQGMPIINIYPDK